MSIREPAAAANEPPIVAVGPPSRFPKDWSLADLIDHLDGIPSKRIRLHPPPGAATEKDVLELMDHKDRLCELIDGVLVEKTVGHYESAVAVALARVLANFVVAHRLGMTLGADGTLKILPDQVRIPDVSYISRERLRGHSRAVPIPLLAPDLAAEVLSPSNTPGEMERKLREYFQAGVRLVWYVDPQTRSARAYTSPGQFQTIAADGMLDGGEVLPGFTFPLRDLFAEVDANFAGPSGREC